MTDSDVVTPAWEAGCGGPTVRVTERDGPTISRRAATVNPRGSFASHYPTGNDPMPEPRNPPRPREEINPSTPPVGRGADETVGCTPATGTPAAPGFGRPVEPGEVGTLGPYRVVKQLGSGGMGAVYAAFDTRISRRLALKVMLPEFVTHPAAKERFLREARAAAQISHDNVVTVYEADESGGVPYIAMQFLQGCP